MTRDELHDSVHSCHSWFPCRPSDGIALLAAVALFVAGCATTPAQFWEKLKGDGFPGWSEAMGSGVRGNKDAKPSGFFTDRRSDQIEKDLGGF